MTHPTGYDRLAGVCAMLAGMSAFLYAVAFIILQPINSDMAGFLSALFLLLLGVLASVAWVAVYGRLHNVSQLALWALLTATIGAVGAAVHGGYDLANAINSPGPTGGSLPSQIDPRGLLTFGFGGLGMLAFSALIGSSKRLPIGLAYLGYLGGVLLVILYFGRLIVLSPTSPVIAIPALLNGFFVGPIWYVWLGVALLRKA